MSKLSTQQLKAALLDLSEYGTIILESSEHAIQVMSAARRLGIGTDFRENGQWIEVRIVNRRGPAAPSIRDVP